MVKSELKYKYNFLIYYIFNILYFKTNKLQSKIVKFANNAKNKCMYLNKEKFSKYINKKYTLTEEEEKGLNDFLNDYLGENKND